MQMQSYIQPKDLNVHVLKITKKILEEIEVKKEILKENKQQTDELNETISDLKSHLDGLEKKSDADKIEFAKYVKQEPNEDYLNASKSIGNTIFKNDNRNPIKDYAPKAQNFLSVKRNYDPLESKLDETLIFGQESFIVNKKDNIIDNSVMYDNINHESDEYNKKIKEITKDTKLRIREVSLKKGVLKFNEKRNPIQEKQTIISQLDQKGFDEISVIDHNESIYEDPIEEEKEKKIDDNKDDFNIEFKQEIKRVIPEIKQEYFNPYQHIRPIEDEYDKEDPDISNILAESTAALKNLQLEEKIRIAGIVNKDKTKEVRELKARIIYRVNQDHNIAAVNSLLLKEASIIKPVLPFSISKVPNLSKKTPENSIQFENKELINIDKIEYIKKNIIEQISDKVDVAETSKIFNNIIQEEKKEIVNKKEPFKEPTQSAYTRITASVRNFFYPKKSKTNDSKFINADGENSMYYATNEDKNQSKKQIDISNYTEVNNTQFKDKSVLNSSIIDQIDDIIEKVNKDLNVEKEGGEKKIIYGMIDEEDIEFVAKKKTVEKSYKFEGLIENDDIQLLQQSEFPSINVDSFKERYVIEYYYNFNQEKDFRVIRPAIFFIRNLFIQNKDKFLKDLLLTIVYEFTLALKLCTSIQINDAQWTYSFLLYLALAKREYYNGLKGYEMISKYKPMLDDYVFSFDEKKLEEGTVWSDLHDIYIRILPKNHIFEINSLQTKYDFKVIDPKKPKPNKIIRSYGIQHKHLFHPTTRKDFIIFDIYKLKQLYF